MAVNLHIVGRPALSAFPARNQRRPNKRIARGASNVPEDPLATALAQGGEAVNPVSSRYPSIERPRASLPLARCSFSILPPPPSDHPPVRLPQPDPFMCFVEQPLGRSLRKASSATFLRSALPPKIYRISSRTTHRFSRLLFFLPFFSPLSLSLARSHTLPSPLPSPTAALRKFSATKSRPTPLARAHTRTTSPLFAHIDKHRS